MEMKGFQATQNEGNIDRPETCEYKAQPRISTQCLNKYLLTYTDQKSPCVLLMGNPFPCCIWTPRCQMTGCSVLSNIKQVHQAPNLPAGLERIALQIWQVTSVFSKCF